ncbi:ABC transporter ATP-binding protein [Paenibacillus antarcticus]|uniref:Heme ABC transporter ATP-binding protein n=1 Tax=Paenibacillus antarcticus TaxID=253703 RepID=A0A168QDB4_9BACL|nr:ABC transporter ATP-binding protein [Paenibacillus antarcticus]OAB47658.1 heme ABC transporter ATP-binding protein [Paenibacillus antarcticus]
MKPIISFQQYSFRYKSQNEPTLRNITLDIYPGEKIWIAGPSGSGKSTLAHCINGLIPFTYSGEITGSLSINDRDPANLSIFELSNTVGTILQDQDAQFVGLTVGEDVAFVMENKAISRPDMKAQVISALTMVDMLHNIEQSPYDLSGGQKQSVSLAGVLSTDADVLLFDEPLANLDPVSGKRAMKLIDDIHVRSGKTIIIIEHRVEDVLQEAIDRIVLMNQGEIAAIGTPDDILSSGLLRKYGLRPPLYADAMEYAGISLDGVKGLSAPQQLDIPGLKGQLDVWTRDLGESKRIALSTPLLELEHVVFGYDKDKTIIKDVSLNVGIGEIVALLGNNGAGKSTLSQLITGILKPQSGRITYAGEDISSWSIRRRGEQIGYVMQNPNHMITQHMIAEEVGLGLKVRGVAAEEIKERVEHVLVICGLYPFRNWPVSALSYGQKKRLSIASILILEPKLMILDEPTAGQDYHHYKEFMDFIRGLAEQGLAFLLITHDMYLALEYAQRAVVLSDGKVIAEDTVASVLSQHEVTTAAHLKETSLSLFARLNDLEKPERLVHAFINYEKEKGHE